MATLIIFIKNPILGNVKTRISKTMGKEKALEIYNKLSQITRQNVLNVKAEKQLYYSDKIEQDDWDEQQFTKFVQKGDDLGKRMYNAFSYSLSFDKKAVIIGSDCPTLAPLHIEKAIEQLDKNDVVIGPSADGGYYLLALKKAVWELFDGIDWSTDKVFRQTLDKIKKLNLSVYTLEVLNDIDTQQDWEEFIHQHPKFQ